MLAAAPPNRRLRLRVHGAVQGVGFRPFAYGLARRLGLSGFVRNDSEGVLIEVEGSGAADFLQDLRREPPPLARIDAIEVAECALIGDSGFAIDATRSGAVRTRIGADAAVCEDCLNELFDPASRFHKYPLVNCTHCGPRYTLTRALPYDRAQTSMAPFPMCEDCARDYADPLNRRFHAEPIACPRCGPDIDAPVSEIARRIAAGEIVAVKGVGGFHLICDARNEAAIAVLRERKRREAKPFAVMVLNSASAERIAEFGDAERDLLTSQTAPIVLMRAKAALAPSLAPGLAEIGVMLPYTPLHWLIFDALCGAPDFASWRNAPCEIALVATSANLGGEPLISDNAQAREQLSGIADLVVCHGRDIVTRADDSVVRMLDGAPSLLRRARGFVPDPIDLGVDGPCVLAHGADLKNTITVTRGREAFVSQYLGDLDDRLTLRFREETTRRLLSLIGVKPEIVACDLHPDFLSTRSAEASGLAVVRVQHHVAHVAATAAEQGWRDGVLGVALDGHGYGDDGAPWGGELLTLDGADWRRIGSLAPLALPGGDTAAREPWRMGVAMLVKLGREAEAARLFPDQPEAPRLAAALRRGARAPMTTSLGRLFDAIAALAGVCPVQRYEGQAAMELEALVRWPLRASPGDWRLEEGAPEYFTPAWNRPHPNPLPQAGEGAADCRANPSPAWGRKWRDRASKDARLRRAMAPDEGGAASTRLELALDLAPFAQRMISERLTPREAAEGFHAALVDGATAWIGAAARLTGRTRVALGGGCLMNRVLAEGLSGRLRDARLQVALPRGVPANDGGISFGQAAFALRSGG